MFSMIIKGQHKVTRCHLAKADTQCMIVDAPSSHERCSDHLTILAHSDVLHSHTGTGWMDVLLVSSYCNPICLAAGRRGFRHQFDCVGFLPFVFFPKLKEMF